MEYFKFYNYGPRLNCGIQPINSGESKIGVVTDFFGGRFLNYKDHFVVTTREGQILHLGILVPDDVKIKHIEFNNTVRKQDNFFEINIPKEYVFSVRPGVYYIKKKGTPDTAPEEQSPPAERVVLEAKPEENLVPFDPNASIINALANMSSAISGVKTKEEDLSQLPDVTPNVPEGEDISAEDLLAVGNKPAPITSKIIKEEPPIVTPVVEDKKEEPEITDNFLDEIGEKEKEEPKKKPSKKKGKK